MFNLAIHLRREVMSLDEDYDRWIKSCEEKQEAESDIDIPEEPKEEFVPYCGWCGDRGCKNCYETEW